MNICHLFSLLSIAFALLVSPAAFAKQWAEPVTKPTPTKLKGDSMLPSFKDGDEVMILPTPFDSLQSGDSVVYLNLFTGKRTHHRLVRLKSGGWVAQGDNNRQADRGLVTRRNYIGKTVKAIRVAE